MSPSKQSSTQQPNSPGKAGAIAFFMLSLVGFADASYLTIEHYRNVIPPCTTSGCETVLTSAYSVVLGVPVSLGGAFYYLAMAIGSFLFLEALLVSGNVKPFHLRIFTWTLCATVLGLVSSLWFLYLQAFVIHSYCQYCLGSAATSTLLFIIAASILAKNRKAAAPIAPSTV